MADEVVLTLKVNEGGDAAVKMTNLAKEADKATASVKGLQDQQSKAKAAAASASASGGQWSGLHPGVAAAMAGSNTNAGFNPNARWTNTPQIPAGTPAGTRPAPAVNPALQQQYQAQFLANAQASQGKVPAPQSAAPQNAALTGVAAYLGAVAGQAASKVAAAPQGATPTTLPPSRPPSTPGLSLADPMPVRRQMLKNLAAADDPTRPLPAMLPVRGQTSQSSPVMPPRGATPGTTTPPGMTPGGTSGQGRSSGPIHVIIDAPLPIPVTMAGQAVRGGGTGTGADAGGAGGGGMLSGAMGKAFAAFAAVQGMQGLARSGANIANIQNDPTLSGSQKQRGTWEAMPVIGGLARTFNDVKDAADGTTVAMKLMQQKFEDSSKAIGAASEFISAKIGTQEQRMGLEAKEYGLAKYTGEGSAMPALGQIKGAADQKLDLAGFAKGLKEAKLPGVDRGTVQGEREFGQQIQRLPLEIAKRQAELEKVGAGTKVDDSKAAVKQQEEVVRARMAEAEAAEDFAKETSKTGTKKEVGQANADAVLKMNQAQAANNALLQLQQNYVQSIGAMEQAGAAARNTNLAIEKQKLAVLVEQENRVKGQAQTWGSMNELQRMQANQIAQIAKERGVASLTDEQKGALRQAGGGAFLDKEAEKLAVKDPNFDAFQDLIGEKKDLKKIQEQRVVAENKVNVSIAFNEKELAESLKSAMGAAIKELEDGLGNRMKIRLDEIAADRRKANQQQR